VAQVMLKCIEIPLRNGYFDKTILSKMTKLCKEISPVAKKRFADFGQREARELSCWSAFAWKFRTMAKDYRCQPYEIPIQCFTCGKSVREAHLYVRKNAKGRPSFFYPAGCLHYDYDCHSWCDGCVTLIKRNNHKYINCATCAGLDFGKPTNKIVKFATMD
jgi:hypothetical protein